MRNIDLHIIPILAFGLLFGMLMPGRTGLVIGLAVIVLVPQGIVATHAIDMRKDSGRRRSYLIANEFAILVVGIALALLWIGKRTWFAH